LNSCENVPQPITINFPGFAHLFAQSNAAAPAAPVPAAPAPTHPVPLPPIEFSIFCTGYSLSQTIQQKLKAIQKAGPHVLRLISDADLHGDGALSMGELASVRDAQF